MRATTKPNDLGCAHEYGEEAEKLWQRFTQDLHEQERIAVLDAALLQNHVRSMLIFNCERDAIFDLVFRIEQLIASHDSVVVYLETEDIVKHFRDVVQSRGQRMLDLWIEAHDQYPYSRAAQTVGFPAFIAFWREFGEISDQIFGQLGVSKLRHCVTGDDGGKKYEGILDFLSLPGPTRSPTELDRFTGEFAPIDDSSPSVIVLRVRSGCLVASCAEPTIDVRHGPFGCFWEVRLLPNGRNCFYVSAWPHEVRFEEDASGAIVGMRSSVSADGWPKSSTAYRKRQ